MQFLLFVIAVVVVSASAFAPAGLRARSSMMMMAERIPIMAGNWKMNTDLEVRACFIRPRILLIYAMQICLSRNRALEFYSRSVKCIRKVLCLRHSHHKVDLILIFSC